jgi:hypothetical protein
MQASHAGGHRQTALAGSLHNRGFLHSAQARPDQFSIWYKFNHRAYQVIRPPFKDWFLKAANRHTAKFL